MNAEQWQELCEWAEFHKDIVYKPHESINGRRRPDGIKCYELPPQDMNTLFKWMVPKLISEHPEIKIRISDWRGSGEPYFVEVKIVGHVTWKLQQSDPTEALAQAIYKAVKNE